MASFHEGEEVLNMVWNGEIEPKFREILPMSEAKKAHEIIENREGFGKVALIPD